YSTAISVSSLAGSPARSLDISARTVACCASVSLPCDGESAGRALLSMPFLQPQGPDREPRCDGPTANERTVNSRGHRVSGRRLAETVLTQAYVQLRPRNAQRSRGLRDVAVHVAHDAFDCRALDTVQVRCVAAAEHCRRVKRQIVCLNRRGV